MIDWFNRLSESEINRRLYEFNMTGDWSVFKDVPPLQQVDVMYPHAHIPGDYGGVCTSKEEYLMWLFPHEPVIKKIELKNE